MKIQRFFTFLTTSIVAGLAAAFVILVLNPQLLQEKKQIKIFGAQLKQKMGSIKKPIRQSDGKPPKGLPLGGS